MFRAVDPKYRGLGLAICYLGEPGQAIFTLNSHLVDELVGQNGPLGSLYLFNLPCGPRATKVFCAVQMGAEVLPCLLVTIGLTARQQDLGEIEQLPSNAGLPTWGKEADGHRSPSAPSHFLRRPGLSMEGPFCSGTSLPPMGSFMSFPDL